MINYKFKAMRPKCYADINTYKYFFQHLASHALAGQASYHQNKSYIKMNRRIIITVILAVSMGANIAAQNVNREKLDAYKIGFLTKRLNLTTREAEKFWPVYNEYQDQRIKIQLERQEINRNFNQNELNMSDREMSEAGDRIIALEFSEAGLAQEFHNKIKAILSPVKVLRLYQAENQYRLQLLNDLREKNQGRNKPNIRQE